MSWNPRIFSLRLGIAAGAGAIVAAFLSLAFDMGNGRLSPQAAYSSALYLFVFSIPLLIPTAIFGVLVVLIGRVIGTAVTAALAFGLLVTLVVSSYSDSQPLTRFRDFIWKGAPDALAIDRGEKWTTFNDGTSYVFALSCDEGILKELCLGIDLKEISRPKNLTWPLFLIFEGTVFPPETRFYSSELIQMAYIPLDKRAYIVRPRRPLSDYASSNE